MMYRVLLAYTLVTLCSVSGSRVYEPINPNLAPTNNATNATDFYYVFIKDKGELVKLLHYLDGTYVRLTGKNYYLDRVSRVGYIFKIPVVEGQEEKFQLDFSRFGVPIAEDEVPKKNLFKYAAIVTPPPQVHQWNQPHQKPTWRQPKIRPGGRYQQITDTSRTRERQHWPDQHLQEQTTSKTPSTYEAPKSSEIETQYIPEQENPEITNETPGRAKAHQENIWQRTREFSSQKEVTSEMTPIKIRNQMSEKYPKGEREYYYPPTVSEEKREKIHRKGYLLPLSEQQKTRYPPLSRTIVQPSLHQEEEEEEYDSWTTPTVAKTATQTKSDIEENEAERVPLGQLQPAEPTQQTSSGQKYKSYYPTYETPREHLKEETSSSYASHKQLRKIYDLNDVANIVNKVIEKHGLVPNTTCCREHDVLENPIDVDDISRLLHVGRKSMLPPKGFDNFADYFEEKNY